MYSTLDKTTEKLRAKVREFAQKEIQPLAESIDAGDKFPRELWPKLGQLGLLGITVDRKLGGYGLGYLQHAIAMEEISRASAAVGLSYSAHSNLCINQLHRFASDGQKKRYLPKLISGEYVGALAMSEANAGSDVMAMQMRAEKKSNYYLLNGSKMWITNGPQADVLIVYARTGSESKNISAFIIEKEFPGYHAAPKLDKVGMRGSDTSELIFENCKVPEENLLHNPYDGAKILMSGLDYERVILAAGPVGIMQACIDTVLPYIHERQQFNHPIGHFELIQEKLANIYTALNASRAYLYAIANACDQDLITRKDAASVILFTAENAVQVALQAIQCLGGNGYLNKFPVGRYLRDAKLYEIGAGTAEIRRIIIGRELFQEGQYA